MLYSEAHKKINIEIPKTPIIIRQFHDDINDINDNDTSNAIIPLIDKNYFVTNTTFKNCQNKFRFVIKKQSVNSSIYGIKLSNMYSVLLKEYQWYNKLKFLNEYGNVKTLPQTYQIGYVKHLKCYGIVFSLNSISLDQILKVKKLDKFNIETSIYILYRVLQCLRHFHCKNIIHCDIKYPNIIIDKRNNFGMIDFDLTTTMKNNLHKLYSSPMNNDKQAPLPLRCVIFIANHHNNLYFQIEKILEVLQITPVLMHTIENI